MTRIAFRSRLTRRNDRLRGATSLLFRLALVTVILAFLASCGGGNSTNTPQSLSITTGTLASGTVGVQYAQTLTAAGGTTPYVWSLISASTTFPPGLAVSGSGVISGQPAGQGTYSFTIQVSDPSGSTSSAGLTITINPGALTVTPTTLNFATSTPQTFTVSGGVGTVTESSNCSQDGVASLVPPMSGTIGTWTASPLNNGVCSVGFTDASNANIVVNIDVDIQSGGGSTMTWQMEENLDCNDVTIYFRFFDETDHLVWPAPPNAYYFPYSNQVYSQPISCSTGANICYGASFNTNNEDPDYWGVGINNDESCTSCCYACATTTTPVVDLSCSNDSPARTPGSVLGSKKDRLTPPITHLPNLGDK